jgi:putative transposase
LVKDHGLSRVRACRLLGLQESSCYYRSSRARDDEGLKEAIKAVCEQKPSYGRPRVVWRLRVVQGMKDNHKRIGRLYREMGLQIGKRPRKKRRSGLLRLALPKPARPLEIWAMDFVHDQLETGRRFRSLTITDLFTHESPAIEVDVSLTGGRVCQVLDRLKETWGLPKTIMTDNGPEFTGKALDQWAYANGVKLSFIQPGKPNQNAYAESFNARFRDECLNQHWFGTIGEAREIVEAWRREFNEERPHSSLGYMTPKQFADVCRQGVAA